MYSATAFKVLTLCGSLVTEISLMNSHSLILISLQQKVLFVCIEFHLQPFCFRFGHDKEKRRAWMLA